MHSVAFSSLSTEEARLNFEQIFHENGFVRIDGVFSTEELAELRDAVKLIVEGFDPKDHPRTTFNTSDEEKVNKMKQRNAPPPLWVLTI